MLHVVVTSKLKLSLTPASANQFWIRFAEKIVQNSVAKSSKQLCGLGYGVPNQIVSVFLLVFG